MRRANLHARPLHWSLAVILKSARLASGSLAASLKSARLAFVSLAAVLKSAGLASGSLGSHCSQNCTPRLWESGCNFHACTCNAHAMCTCVVHRCCCHGGHLGHFTLSVKVCVCQCVQCRCHGSNDRPSACMQRWSLVPCALLLLTHDSQLKRGALPSTTSQTCFP